MALRLNQIKKASPPQRKKADSDFRKEKSHLPFEHGTSTPSAQTETVTSDAPSENVLEAAVAASTLPPTSGTKKSDLGDLNNPTQKVGEYPTHIQHKSDTVIVDSVHSPIETPSSDIQHISDTNSNVVFDTYPTHKSDTYPTQGIAFKSNLISNHADTTPISNTNPTQISDTRKIASEHIYPTQKLRCNDNADHSKKIQFEDVNPTHIRHKKGTKQKTSFVSDTYPTQTPTISNTYPTPYPTPSRDFGGDAGLVDKRVATLSGQKRTLGIFIANYFTQSGNSSFVTTYDGLALSSGISAGSIRTTLKRLRDGGFINISSSGPGRGAMIAIEMPHEPMRAFLKIFVNSAKESIVFRHNSDTQSDKFPSSSSSLNINTTTRTEDEIPEPWKDIVIPPYLATKGFSITHAKQILSDNNNTLSVEDVQESFDNFCADLEHEKVHIKFSPIMFFMGVVRKRRTKYESVFLAEQEEMAFHAHQKALQKSWDALKSAKMEALAGKYEAWKNSLTPEQIEEIAPAQSHFEDSNGVIRDRMLKAHFNKMNGVDD